MSLNKMYRVQCEGPSLATRLGLLKSGPGVLFHEHVAYGPIMESSTKARRLAIKNGWKRIRKDMPLTRDPDGPTSEIAFDLCPSCAQKLADR